MLEILVWERRPGPLRLLPRVRVFWPPSGSETKPCAEGLFSISRSGSKSDPDLKGEGTCRVPPVNEDFMVRQVLLESFKENEKSLHLQNFITRRTVFSDTNWIPLGVPEDAENFQEGVSLYSAYRRYVDGLAVKTRNVCNFTEFKQELLPLINQVCPQWEIFERRRRHPETGKRVFGLLNIELSAQNQEVEDLTPLNLEPFRQAPFWVRPASDHTGDGRPVVAERPASDHTGDGRPVVAAGHERRVCKLFCR